MTSLPACRAESKAVGPCLLAILLLLVAMSAAADIDVYRQLLRAGDADGLQAQLIADGGDAPLGSRGETLLHMATSHNQAENRPQLIAVLLRAGLAVDARDNSGLTPLHWAAGFGCVPCVAALLDAGANPQAPRNDGATPLHRAAPETVSLLLAAGADPLARDKHGRVPLHTAYQGSDSLLVAGVNCRDNYGMTPLHYAALTGNIDQVHWLLAQGADPALQTAAPFHFNGDEPPDSWEPRHVFDTGTRPYDIAKWQHLRTRWSIGGYSRALDALDRVTPRRHWFSR